MCNEAEIMELVQQGKQLESKDPESAAQNYLLAADLLVKESSHHPEREQEYLVLANKIYLKAKELRSQPAKGLISLSDNKITFNHIGGLEELKQEIRMKIIEPFKNPELFKYYGKQAGGGILMYGPPGCGKSLIAKATANEAKVNFIHVKASDLKSKYVGETEKNIAELFEKAREAQPTILFFDEFEALGSDRSESLQHEKNAVAQLLTEMDGMDAKEQQILLLAATNEPWAIDPALRREGRFGTTIYIPPPDLEARKAILKIHLRKKPTEELDFDKLAELTNGSSGADLKAVCELATDIPLKESLQTGKRRKITVGDVKKAIADTKSVLEQWYNKAAHQVKKKNLEEQFGELLGWRKVAA